MSFSDQLDGLIAVFAPGWAAQRRISRLALGQSERLGGFRESRTTRLDQSVTSRGASGDWELEQGNDRRALVDRARLAERDDLLAGSLLDRACETVIGDSGFRLQAHSEDESWNERLEALWRDWTQNEADSRGLLSWPELLARVFRSYLRDGDVGAILQSNGSLRIVESDEISSNEGYSRTNLVDGIDLDLEGRPTFFHVIQPSKTVTPDRRFAVDRIKVPAREFVFLARRTRSSQTRGLTIFNGIFWILEQLDGLIEAETVRARMAACFGMVIKRNGAPGVGLPTTTDAAGETKRKLRLEPGGFVHLLPGEDITPVQGGPITAMEGHVRFLIRLAGTRFGMPVEVSLGDFSQSNFSSSRGAITQYHRTVKMWQEVMARFCSRVFEWKVLNWIASGELDENEQALAHSWTKPGIEWIDPVAEVQAAQAAIDSGLDTRTAVLARRGLDIEDVDRVIKKERTSGVAAGLPGVRSTLTRDPLPPPAPAGESPKKPPVKARSADLVPSGTLG